MNWQEKSTVPPPSPVFIAIFVAAIAVCIVAILMGLVLSIDHSDELFNALRYNDHWHRKDSMYANRWEPFKGCNFFECVGRIPQNLYIGLVHFPTAFLIGVIFFPLMIFVGPVYEGFVNAEFTMLLYAWLPFLGGVILFMVAGLIAEKRGVQKLIAEKNKNRKF